LNYSKCFEWTDAKWADEKFYPNFKPNASSYKNSEVYAQGTVSAIIGGRCYSGKEIVSTVEVVDQTDLVASLGSNLKGISSLEYQIMNDFLVEPGIIRPSKKKDSLTFTMPSFVNFFGSPISIKLPQFSDNGVPLGWGGSASNHSNPNCHYVYRFVRDIPAELVVTKETPSRCKIAVGHLFPTDKYEDLYIEYEIEIRDGIKAEAEAKAKAEAEAKAKAAAELKAKQEAEAAAKAAANKKTTIMCVKGKLIKRVTAVNPKCPNGYKKK